MSAVIVRYQTNEGAAEENQRLVEQVYAELAATDPGGLRYITLRLPDGVSFVHVSLVDGEENPLGHVAAFAAFQKGLSERLIDPPVVTPVTVVGSYGI